MKRIMQLTCLVATFVISTASYADGTLADVVTAITNFQNYILKLATTLDVYAANNATTNNALLTAVNQADTSTTNSSAILNQNTIAKALTSTPTSATNMTNLLSVMTAADSANPNQNTFLGASTSTAFAQQQTQGNQTLTANILLNPLTYNATQQKQAQKYIQFAANLATPVKQLDTSKLTPAQMLKLQTKPSYKTYEVAVRSILAARSVALANLYKAYAERTPLTIDANGTSTSQSNNPPISVLSQREMLATQRITSPDWYKNMATQPVTVIDRESLYIQAEMRYEMYQMHKDMERLLVTMSMLQIQGLQANEQGLGILLNKVQQDINSITGTGHSQKPPTRKSSRNKAEAAAAGLGTQ